MLLVITQEILFGKKLFFDWQLGDNWALRSMELLEKELLDLKKNSEVQDDGDGQDVTPKYVYKRKIVWFNAIGFLILHLTAVYGLYLVLTSLMIFTMIWSK